MLTIFSLGIGALITIPAFMVIGIAALGARHHRGDQGERGRGYRYPVHAPPREVSHSRLV
jgi:hypothetical protein